MSVDVINGVWSVRIVPVDKMPLGLSLTIHPNIQSEKSGTVTVSSDSIFKLFLGDYFPLKLSFWSRKGSF